jgi:hypothetical protein
MARGRRQKQKQKQKLRTDGPRLRQWAGQVVVAAAHFLLRQGQPSFEFYGHDTTSPPLQLQSASVDGDGPGVRCRQNGGCILAASLLVAPRHAWARSRNGQIKTTSTAWVFLNLQLQAAATSAAVPRGFQFVILIMTKFVEKTNYICHTKKKIDYETAFYNFTITN